MSTDPDQWRGHTIYKKGSDWVYADTQKPVHLNPDRPCGFCGAANTIEGHDGCLGTLPGAVMNACCGHGNPYEAYIQFDDGHRISGSLLLALESEEGNS